MNMFNLVSRFWRAAEEKPFSPSEAALYFYLLHKANTQKWQMPIRCPTSTISIFLSTSKQNVMKAREGLRQRGFITYKIGSGTNDAPMYTIIESNTELSDELSGQLSPQLSGRLSGQLSLYKNKDKDNISHTAREDDVLPLDDLETMFLDDEPWQESILSLPFVKNKTTLVNHLSGSASEITTTDTLKIHISQFFAYLRASGHNKREVKDTKNYFVNWLKKQPLFTHHDAKAYHDHQDRRRATDVSSAPTEDYYQSF